jgi:UDP-N-acetyl-D-galactosamine dehydrogenase
MIKEIKNKEAKIAVIGLGYVGLPIALEFAKQAKVIGFDIHEGRVKKLQRAEDPSQELGKEAFEGCDITFTADPEDLREATVFIVAVPTPIDDAKLPDLKPLLGATANVGKVLKKGDYVIFESTVYPGCTEDDCVPVLEKESGLKFIEDFKVGYSPERINPGDKTHTLHTVVKVVSGCDEESSEEVAELYEMVVDAGVHRAASIKVAEAAKIIENTQRDVNIALINELSIIFSKLGINTYEVLEAAGTKWNFLNFYPGLVGGHCIGVDPYYLTHKAKQVGYHAKIINSGRYVNDSMGFYLGKQTVKKIIGAGVNVMEARVLVLGATFKENVSDIRNSKVVDLIKEMESFAVHVEVMDPHADSDELFENYGFSLITEPKGKYDAVVVAVNHNDYADLNEKDFEKWLTPKGIVVDVKGTYRNKITNFKYLSL